MRLVTISEIKPDQQYLVARNKPKQQIFSRNLAKITKNLAKTTKFFEDDLCGNVWRICLCD